MPIAALSEATVHLLGSAQCLTTPTSLVKELIDNGLDAKATSLDILISQNTIDKIQVRDNGHGIPHEDLHALGKRGHTSKLRSFDELKFIGGASLGFRGEALASAVQLGEVSLTTRIDGEPVAATVVLKAQGGIDRQSRTSHPIGTTVCVANFMAKIPVRKQTALKSSSKTLAKIKELVHAYALARPSVRFSVKVINESKSSWSFALRPNDGIREAVSQVIGRAASMQCMQQSFTFPRVQSSHSPHITKSLSEGLISYGQFQVDMFLPRPDAEPTKIGQGQYASIDGRPISHEKGTMKRVIVMFKSYIKGVFGDAFELKSPFIRFNIKCPAASYDPNVEPSKDDILFANESLILESIEGIFKEVYGEIKAIPSSTLKSVQSQKLNHSELLYARKPDVSQAPIELSTPLGGEPLPTFSSRNLTITQGPISTVVDGPVNELGPAISNARERTDDYGTVSPRKWEFDMSDTVSEEVEERRKGHCAKKLHIRQPEGNENQQTESDRLLNSWAITKMAAPLQPNNQYPPIQTRPNFDHHDQQNDPVSTPLQREVPKSVLFSISLPAPLESNTLQQQQSNNVTSLEPPLGIEGSFSIQNQAPHERRHSKDDTNLSVGPICPTILHQRRNSDGSQPTGLLPNINPLTPGYPEEPLFVTDEHMSTPPQRPNNFISARQVAGTHLISPPPSQAQNYKTNRSLKKPFVNPWRPSNNPTLTHGLRQTTLGVALQPAQIQEDERLQSEPNPELEWAMDFEQRKKHASLQRRQEIRDTRKAADKINGVDDSIRTSPHKNRYNAAVAALQVDHLASHNTLQSNGLPKTSLPRHDPRAYFIRHQQFIIAQGDPLKLTRAKSMKLPLETIPDDAKMHALVLTLSPNANHFRKIAVSTSVTDEYVAHGNYATSPGPLPADISKLTAKIQAVIEKWTKTEERNMCEVEYSFENILKDTPSSIA